MTIKLSPADFTAKLAAVGKLSSQTLSMPSGSVSHSGVTVGYTYDTGAEVLSLEVVKKPFFVSESYVEQQITAWFAGS